MINLNRKIKLEGTFNTRDLGGFIIKNKFIKSHMLVRSDNTAYLSELDINFLVKYGIRTIIDIRSQKEQEEEQDITSTLDVFSYFFIPFDCDNFAYNLSRNPFALNVSLYEGYKLLLGQKSTVRMILTQIENSLHNGGVLFHCTGGKDRTGLISMLLLSVLGLERDCILADYHLTYDNLMSSENIRKWVDCFGEEYIFCLPELMNKTINYLYKKYGNIENYLSQCNISTSLIQSIRNQLLDGV